MNKIRKIAEEVVISDNKEITQHDLDKAARLFFNGKYGLRLNLASLDENYKKIKEENFDGKDCGIMNAMIKNGRVEILAGLVKGTVYIRIEFSYNHPDGGSNGHIDYFKFEDEKWARDL